MISSFKKITTALFLVFFASLANAADADETQASRFLYCANVAQFYYQYFLKHEPNSEKVSTFRLTRNNFRLAAAATKKFPDPQSFSTENEVALNKVIAILEREKTENAELMSTEAKNCAETMNKEVVPLLKPKNAQAN